MPTPSLLPELQVLALVAETGSFTGAARQLAVPTSTVSRSVTRLEGALRAALVHRAGRAVSLTAAGRALVARAAPHLAGLREVQGEFLEGEAQLQGVLRVTATPTLADAFLGEQLVRFTARHPRLQVEVELSARAVDLVREGYDVGLRAARRLPDDAALIARKLADTEVLLYASPDYLARRGAPASPEELAGHACIPFQPREARGGWALEGPGGRTCDVPATGQLLSGDLSLLRAVLRAGAGVGPLPSYFAAEDAAAGRLVQVLPGWRHSASALFVVYPATRHVPRRVAAFRDFLVESFRRRAAGT
jgi:DNA-binding transcriptional LysR family regulator